MTHHETNGEGQGRTDHARCGDQARCPRRGPSRPARAAPIGRARRLDPGARRLAGHPAGPVHRRDAGRRSLHRRRPTLLDGAGRRAEHALARRRRAQTAPRAIRGGVPQARGHGTVRRSRRARGPRPGRRPRTRSYRRDPPRPRGSPRGQGGCGGARPARRRAGDCPRLVRRDRRRGRPSLGRWRDRPQGPGGRGHPRGACVEHDPAWPWGARRGDRDADAGRGRLERGGHDVRRDRDRRRHDDEPVLAPAVGSRPVGSPPRGPHCSGRTPSRNRSASSPRQHGSIAMRRSTSTSAGRRSDAATSSSSR